LRAAPASVGLYSWSYSFVVGDDSMNTLFNREAKLNC
jgi:hypothetical protein